jgi:ABC-type Mn2+/Zn2+ transport system ATPase subunit
MSDPSLLILDEPSVGLAPLVQDEVFATIQAINRLGPSILMVEQRARQCLAIAHFRLAIHGFSESGNALHTAVVTRICHRRIRLEDASTSACIRRAKSALGYRSVSAQRVAATTGAMEARV